MYNYGWIDKIRVYGFFFVEKYAFVATIYNFNIVNVT